MTLPGITDATLARERQRDTAVALIRAVKAYFDSFPATDDDLAARLELHPVWEAARREWLP